MKKRNLLAVLLLATVSFCSVQAQDVKGKNFINAGIGIGTFGFSGTGGLPITASVEHGFNDKISAGLYLGLVQRKFYDEFKYNYKVIGVRGSYHFNELLKVANKKLDVYGGASIYYRGYTLKYEGIEGKEKLSSGTIGIGLHAAARYMFAKNIGGYGELGYGVSPLQLGLTVVL